MRAALAAIVILVCISRTAAAEADRSLNAMHVRAYDAVIEPDVEAGTIAGRETVRVSLRRRSATVGFDCGALVVESASDRDGPLRFVVDDHRLTVTLRTPRDAGATFTLTFRYHGAPTHGVRFFPDAKQVVSVFSTSEWLVCLDAPSERASLRLTIVAPTSWAVVPNGREATHTTLADGRVAHEFREDRDVPSYTFGFGAGRFDDTLDRQGGVALRYLTSGLSADEIRRVFETSRDMLTFFERTAGVAYPERTYTQVVTTGAGMDGQEMSGFSTLTSAYAQQALTGPRGATLAAHEFAHQWWGNSVTCRDWTHFWLNEGFATFMAAAYVEHRFGRSEYDRLIAEYQATYARLRESGHDKSKVFADWRHPTADDRALVYRKGAYVLHLLREEVGEAAFWAGIRGYTRAYSEASVETADFQRAMERSAKRSLASFFDRWVYLRDAGDGR